MHEGAYRTGCSQRAQKRGRATFSCVLGRRRTRKLRHECDSTPSLCTLDPKLHPNNRPFPLHTTHRPGHHEQDRLRTQAQPVRDADPHAARPSPLDVVGATRPRLLQAKVVPVLGVVCSRATSEQRSPVPCLTRSRLTFDILKDGAVRLVHRESRRQPAPA